MMLLKWKTLWEVCSFKINGLFGGLFFMTSLNRIEFELYETLIENTEFVNAKKIHKLHGRSQNWHGTYNDHVSQGHICQWSCKTAVMFILQK
jgi:hypothetical protein